MKTRSSILFGIAFAAMAFTSCKKDESILPTPSSSSLPIKTQSDVFANDPDGHFTFFNLSTGMTVDLADSAGTSWDIAFHATTILLNGGTSGPGMGAALVADQSFSNVTTAPDDSAFGQDNGTTYAIPTGSGNGWYNYDGVNMVINPIPGRTIVIRTADGHYAKMEILSYYQGAPASPTMADVSRYYTFRYALQADGSKKLD